MVKRAGRGLVEVLVVVVVVVVVVTHDGDEEFTQILTEIPGVVPVPKKAMPLEEGGMTAARSLSSPLCSVKLLTLEKSEKRICTTMPGDVLVPQ